MHWNTLRTLMLWGTTELPYCTEHECSTETYRFKETPCSSPKKDKAGAGLLIFFSEKFLSSFQFYKQPVRPAHKVSTKQGYGSPLCTITTLHHKWIAVSDICMTEGDSCAKTSSFYATRPIKSLTTTNVFPKSLCFRSSVPSWELIQTSAALNFLSRCWH